MSKKSLFFLAVATIIFIVFSMSVRDAKAQTTPSLPDVSVSEAASAAASDEDPQTLGVTLADPLIIKPDEPTVAKANFLEVLHSKDGKPEKRRIIGLEDVLIEGVVAPEAENHLRRDGTLSKNDLARIGSFITWNAVSLTQETPDGDEKTNRALLPTPLKSTYEEKGPVLPTGTPLSAEGDINGAIATAKKLLSENTEQAPVPEPPQDEDEKEEKPKDTPQVQGGGNTGGGSEGNNNLGQTESYEISEPDPAPVLSTTTEGCEHIPNVTQLIVQETSRLTEDGTPTGDCGPSGTQFTLQKTASSCVDFVTVESLEANPQYKLYYVNKTGQTIYVRADGSFAAADDPAACQRDTETVFSLYEDTAFCEDHVDYTAGSATPQSRLVYENANNVTIVVQDCRIIAGTTPITFFEDPTQCSYRIDNDAGKAIAQAETFYINGEGARIKVEGCKDATTITATDLFQERGTCGYEIDRTNGQALPRAETFYKNAEGAHIKVADCQLMASAQAATFFEDPTQCGFRLESSNAQAIPQAETYFTDHHGAKIKVEDCRDATSLNAVDFFEERADCGYRADSANGEAIPQVKTFYLNHAGIKVEVQGCKDEAGATTAVFFEDPGTCGFRIDETLNKAVPQAETFYQTLEGQKIKVHECQDATSLQNADLFEEVAQCDYRLDRENGQAIQQVETFYLNLQGAKVKVADCHDATVPITADFFEDPAQCSFGVDGAQVVPMAELYYLTSSGAKIKVEDCREAQTIAQPTLLEDMLACGVRTDTVTNQAIKQSKLYYIRTPNYRVDVTDCQDSQNAETIAIYETTDICGIRDDFANNESVQLARKVYEMDGDIRQVTPCADSDITYDHHIDRESCRDIEIFTAGAERFQKQIKKYIVTDAGPLVISVCEPDPDNNFGVETTTVGCDADFRHDIQGERSIGTKRYFYRDHANVQQFLKGGACQPDTTRTYTHQVRIAGYDHKDAEKLSYPLMEVFIDTEFGEKLVAPAALAADVTPLPYVYEARESRQTSNVYYEGCNKFTEVGLFEIWTNAAEERVEYSVGTDDPIGPVNACAVEDTCKTPSGWTAVSAHHNISNNGSAVNECRNNGATSTWVAKYDNFGGQSWREFSCNLRTIREDKKVINEIQLLEQSARTYASVYTSSRPPKLLICVPHPTTEMLSEDLANIRANHGF